MEFSIQKALEHYHQVNVIKEACQLHCDEIGIEYSEKYRHRLSRHLKSSGKFDYDLENENITETNQYLVPTLSALKTDGTIMKIEEYCHFYGIPYEDVRTYKLVTHTGRGAYYNIASNQIKGEGLEKFYEKLLEEIALIPNKPKSIWRSDELVEEESYLLVISPADVHIGKLAMSFETGDDYNNQIAVKRVREGIQGILDKVKGFKIDQILFLGGNDILHIDTPKNTTTPGTPQDVDGMWYTNFLIAKELYIEVLDKLLTVSDVHFIHTPSNHDWTHGFFLADVIRTYYRDCENITFDCDIQHRKYFTYYNNLIGSTHGDGAKAQDLPLLMAHESKDWSNCKHKYVYTGHLHHKVSKDYMGVCVETLRSPSGTDGWHSRNGFDFAPKAIEAFLHSKNHGQIARISNIF